MNNNQMLQEIQRLEHIDEASTSVNQVKADKVRRIVPGMLERVSNLQEMMRYGDEEQRKNLPGHEFILYSKDSIVQKPYGTKEGKKWRPNKKPHYTVLAPSDKTEKELAKDLIALGTAMLKGKKKTNSLTFNLLHPNDNQEGLFEKDLYGRTYYKKNDDDKGTTKQKDKKKKKEGSKKADGTGLNEENKDNSGGKAI